MPCQIFATLSAFLLFLPLLAASARAQQPLHLDFERMSTEGWTRPWNWTPLSYAPGATAAVDDGVARTGSRSLRIARPSSDPFPGPHALATYLPPLAALGRTVRVKGWIRSEALEGKAYLTIQSWANFQVLASDSAGSTSGSSAWSHYEIEIPVPADTETLVITANLEGSGTAWFDDLTLLIDDVEVEELPIARDVGEEEILWLAGHSAPLRTVDAMDDDFEDLDLLGRIVGTARIVALGESTHGTSEFFRLKHRVLEYLVREHGFRLFAIEDQQLAMEQVNAYVLGGPGTVRDVMRHMFGVWNTVEVRDLIEWMRGYNAEHPDDPVRFAGFDMQNPSLPIDSLYSFAQRHDPELHGRLKEHLDDYREAWRRSSYPQYMVADSVRRRWADGAEAARRLVEDQQEAWLAAAVSAEEREAVEWAVQNARVAAQAGRYIFGYQPDRDSSMAANLAWLLDRYGPDTRAVVWAHDSHISKGRASTTQGNYFVRSMGAYLDHLFGDDYRAFAIMSYDGTYTAIRSMWGGPRDLAVIEAFPAPRGSIEESFHRVAEQLDAQMLIADLRPASGDAAGRMLLEPRPYRFVGYAAEDYGFNGSIEAAHQFDGLLFIDRTTGSRPVGREHWPPEVE